MPIIPNMRSSAPNALQHKAPPVPLALVDTPEMDYVKWLGNGAPIAEIEQDSASHVAVVGSGAGGLAAAYELLRCGIDVTVFEATGRIGGRLLTLRSRSGSGNIFEMGAMRFTPSERLLHHYAKSFTRSGTSDVRFGRGPFPDPGGADCTYVAFRSKTYVHEPMADDSFLPPSGRIVSAGWKAFVEEGFESADGSIRLEAPERITRWLAGKSSKNLPAIRSAWQSYLDHFGGMSVYEAMVRIFADPAAPGGKPWSREEVEFFGAAGTGVGGFGPLFPISFVDIMRSVVNAVDSDQHELLTGVQSLIDGFLNQRLKMPGGRSITLRDRILTDIPVIGIVSTGPGVELTLADGSKRSFDRVVVATSHRSMELSMNLGFSQEGSPLAEPVADALRRLHIENSTKLFVETRDFWSSPEAGRLNWPRNVVGDTLLRNLYVLTYPQAKAGTGALLLSYAWADDSLKQQSISDPQERLELLLRDLDGISPEFGRVVRANIEPETVELIDWQTHPWYFGAFKLAYPGQDPYAQALFYDFRKAGGPEDTGVYLAGDSIGFLGAWVENALQTGVNAAAAAALSLGGRILNWENSPFKRLSPGMYDYGGAASAR